MKYFTECKSLDEAKNLFKKLCFKLHPDTSGFDSNEEFLNMFNEFTKVSNTLKFKTGFDRDKDFNAHKFYDTVKKFDHITDIKISFVGCFIWLEGTEHYSNYKDSPLYQQKDLIKTMKLDGYNPARYASKKIAWYFSPENYEQKYSQKKTLEEIKNTYGSTEFLTKDIKRLTKS